MQNAIGIIPARLASSRFPRKILANIAGKSLLQRTYEKASQSSSLDKVVIATDDQSVIDHANSFGAQAFMTSTNHKSGTDRIAEVVENHFQDAKIIVNIQGDEPLLNPNVIDTLVELLNSKPETVCTTAAVQFADNQDINDPSAVKCVFDNSGKALYFSRTPIPSAQHSTNDHPYYLHMGIYCFRKPFLLTYANLKRTPLQQIEDLEQLKIIEHGYPIHVAIVKEMSIGVDTPEDLKKVEEICLENTSL